ncbi:hypothetical protein ACOZ38_28515 [Sphaerisporangium viridialbum]|uniref:hypothetical protein n=1 Tax=Sphaerisporangium viridialbum TaxID=46189 RepID=UPI003C771C16
MSRTSLVTLSKVAAEKDTLRVMFTSWLVDLGIPVLVVRGFGSQSYVDVVRDRTRADPRRPVLLYVGDFDCSGADIEREPGRASVRQPGRTVRHLSGSGRLSPGADGDKRPVDRLL